PTEDQFRLLLEHIQGKSSNLSPKSSLSQQRRLAAILFTDIVGYTSMMQQNETEALTIIKRYTTVLKQSVSDHSGEVLNDYGDSSLCIFSSASEAVQSALEVQEQLQKDPSIPLRIG